MGKLNVNVVVEGVEYRKVDRNAQEGDIIRFEDAPFTLITAGGFYAVNEIDSCGDAQITNDDGGSYDTCGDTFEVYEKVADKAAVPARLTVGDYARVIKNEDGHEAEIGAYIKIVEDDQSELPFKATYADGSRIPGGEWFNERELIRATEAEFLAQQPKPFVEAPQDDVVTHRGRRYRKEVRSNSKGIESGALVIITKEHVGQPHKAEESAQSRIPVGSYAQLITLDNGSVRGFYVGDVVKVNVETRKDRYAIQRVDGTTGYTDADKLVILSAKSFSDAQAEAAVTAKWTAIGRKVNEYKAGDLVTYLRKDGESGLGTVEDVAEGSAIGVRSGTAAYSTEKYRGVFFNAGDTADLVTPVEQRFDKR